MPDAGFDAQAAYEVWREVICDEALCEAVLQGRHAELAASRGMSAREVAVLDELHHQPGLRWNVENLRFRATDHVLATLRAHLPLTLHLLTRGDADWQRDLVFEYLAHHRWEELGRRHLAECARFGEHVRARIARRRALPELVEHALAAELGVVELLLQAAAIPEDGWGRRREPPSDAELSQARPRPGPAVRLLSSPVDLTSWLTSGDPTSGQPGPGPVTLLLTVPSPEEAHRVERLNDGARLVLDRCRGARTSAQIARDVHQELKQQEAFVLALLRRWVLSGALRL